MDIQTFVGVDTEDLIHEMNQQLTPEELIQFVKDLDLTVGDWEFTEELYKYFKKEHKTYKLEVREN